MPLRGDYQRALRPRGHGTQFLELSPRSIMFQKVQRQRRFLKNQDLKPTLSYSLIVGTGRQPGPAKGNMSDFHQVPEGRNLQDY